MDSKNSKSRTVYSTSTGRICPKCGKPIANCSCRKKQAQSILGDGNIRVYIERKGRGGKTVTTITGLPLNEKALRELAKELKRKCGSGGAIKDGNIEIQGEHRETLLSLLNARGFKAKAAGG